MPESTPAPIPPNERRRRFLATAASLAFHIAVAVLFGAFLSSLFVHKTDREKQAIETITIARKTPPPPTPTPSPKPKVAPKTLAAPQPQLATEPPPPPVANRTQPPLPPRVVELSRPKPKAPVRRPAKPVIVAPLATQPPVLARGTHRASKPPGKARLSSSQIASITNDLAGAIAADKSANDPLKVANPEPVATMKDYGGSYSGFDDVEGAHRGHGDCDPVDDTSRWESEGYDYYYIACEVHLDGGGQRREIVPWPVRFLPTNDPFRGTARGGLPVAMPLPGWHPDARTVIPPELRQYAKDNGVDL